MFSTTPSVVLSRFTPGLVERMSAGWATVTLVCAKAPEAARQAAARAAWRRGKRGMKNSCGAMTKKDQARAGASAPKRQRSRTPPPAVGSSAGMADSSLRV